MYLITEFHFSKTMMQGGPENCSLVKMVKIIKGKLFNISGNGPGGKQQMKKHLSKRIYQRLVRMVRLV